MPSAVRYLVSRLVSLIPPTGAFRIKARLWKLAGIKVSPSARIISSACFHTISKMLNGPVGTVCSVEEPVLSGLDHKP